MIVREFERRAGEVPDKIVLKAGERSLTYGFLNRYANRLAGLLRRHIEPGGAAAALLLNHDETMIVSIIAVLKAGGAYIPFDPGYPLRRLNYMVKDAHVKAVITAGDHVGTAVKLTHDAPIPIINIEKIDQRTPAENPGTPRRPGQLAYILYTSGSTGKPKGVGQTHESVVYFIENWTRRFSLQPTDRATLISSFSHDGSIPDIFSALLNGAALYPYDLKKNPPHGGLSRWLIKEKITVWHSVPTVYRFFINTLGGGEKFPHLRLIVLGGEQVRKHDIVMFNKYFPGSAFGNIYGQTESTVNSTWLLAPGDSWDEVLVGKPIHRTEIVIVDEQGNEVEELEVGEIVIGSRYVSPGYVNDPGAAAKVFTPDEELGSLYWTGDLGRWLPDGNIEIMGRKDSQIKIRGFRIEPGEIETALLECREIKEAVVLAREKDEDMYLCAYLVSGKKFKSEELRGYLAGKLPGYMIPFYFITLGRLPRTPSGKVDRKALPRPWSAVKRGEHRAPGDEWEKALVHIWAGLFNLEEENIGIDDHFFELGGHSLKAIGLAAEVHEKLAVKLPLSQVFKTPRLGDLAGYLRGAVQDRHISTEPVEEKEYYAVFSAQRRLYIMQHVEPDNTAYNIPTIVILEGELDLQRLERAFLGLLKRHDSLRTSFHMIKDRVVQKVHKDVEFSFQYHDMKKPGAGEDVVENFVRPFELSRASLMRTQLVKSRETRHILMVDLHHIISDGVSNVLLVRDFAALYQGNHLPGLRLRYSDFSQWRARGAVMESIASQKTYWLNRFARGVPPLNLPLDYPRPPTKTFDGRKVDFLIRDRLYHRLKGLLKETGTTAFMVLLAVYNILLSRYARQPDIVVGTPSAGRRQADLHNIIGMFVNMLALRNQPVGGKTFRDFLAEVKQNALEAYENQDYQFEELVTALRLQGAQNRNPVFDTAFAMQQIDVQGAQITGFKKIGDLAITPYEFEKRTTPFDLLMTAFESGDTIAVSFEYSTHLFKRSTVEKMIPHYLEILGQVVENSGIKLAAINMSHDLVEMTPGGLSDDRGDFGF